MFLAKKNVVNGTVVGVVIQNELITWLSDGLLLLYIILGHHIITGKEADAKILRNLILGFTVWSIVLAIINLAGFSVSGFLQSLGLSPSDSILLNISTGYIVMFAIYMLMVRRGERSLSG